MRRREGALIRRGAAVLATIDDPDGVLRQNSVLDVVGKIRRDEAEAVELDGVVG